MTAALATRARQQQALSGRWLLEPVQHIDGPVLLVGSYRRPAPDSRPSHAPEQLHMSTLGT
jgi:hypothetical protein